MTNENSKKLITLLSQDKREATAKAVAFFFCLGTRSCYFTVQIPENY